MAWRRRAARASLLRGPGRAARPRPERRAVLLGGFTVATRTLGATAPTLTDPPDLLPATVPAAAETAEKAAALTGAAPAARPEPPTLPHDSTGTAHGCAPIPQPRIFPSAETARNGGSTRPSPPAAPALSPSAPARQRESSTTAASAVPLPHRSARSAIPARPGSCPELRPPRGSGQPSGPSLPRLTHRNGEPRPVPAARARSHVPCFPRTPIQ